MRVPVVVSPKSKIVIEQNIYFQNFNAFFTLYFTGKKVPKILQLAREARGLNADPDDDSLLDKLTPNVPGIVKFADHNRTLPWSTEYSTVLIFADVSGS